MGHLILMLQGGMTDFLEVTRIKKFLENGYAALPHKDAENNRLAAHKARAASEKDDRKLAAGRKVSVGRIISAT